MAAVRFTFGYRGDEVWVLDVRRVETVAPLSGELGVALAGRSGFWCELRDAAGNTVYRQVLRDPRHGSDEVPGRQRHVPNELPAGAFTVVVPDDVDGRTLALVQRRSGDAEPVDVLTAAL
jgi:hypothetical protein